MSTANAAAFMATAMYVGVGVGAPGPIDHDAGVVRLAPNLAGWEEQETPLASLVSKALGASVYSNAPGGRQIYHADYYRENGVELDFYEPVSLSYETPGFEFVPDLSIIDPLMWLGIAAMAEWCRTR